MSDKNLDKCRVCVKTGKSASEALVLLTLAYAEYAMKKSCFYWQRWFKEGQVDVQGDQRSGQKKAQDRYKHGQSTSLGTLCLKIRHETNSRRTEYEQGKKCDRLLWRIWE
jgi:hypothetical protein